MAENASSSSKSEPTRRWHKAKPSSNAKGARSSAYSCENQTYSQRNRAQGILRLPQEAGKCVAPGLGHRGPATEGRRNQQPGESIGQERLPCSATASRPNKTPTQVALVANSLQIDLRVLRSCSSAKGTRRRRTTQGYLSDHCVISRAHRTHSLLRIPLIADPGFPVFACGTCGLYSSCRVVGLKNRCTEHIHSITHDKRLTGLQHPAYV